MGKDNEYESFNTPNSLALVDAASGCVDSPAVLAGLQGELLVQ